MKFFEHKVVNLGVEAAVMHQSSYAGIKVDYGAVCESALDKFGDQGWELTTITATPEKDRADGLVVLAWFKREVTTGADAPAPPG